MTVKPCPFCEPPPEKIFFEGKRIVCLWDSFPVSPGHALLVPRRHVADWFEASPEEQAELTQGISLACAEIRRRFSPAGFNFGVNIGAAAGQTIFHLHLHVIPRYARDVEDPRGGVRHVIPTRGNYLTGPWGRDDRSEDRLRAGLVRGGDDPLFPHLATQMAQAREVDIAVGFVLPSGVERIEEHLRDLLRRGGKLRLLTGDYLDVTDPDALLRLLDLHDEDGIEMRVFETRSWEARPRPAPGSSFHPKAYIFRDAAGTGVAFVGSSNLTETALRSGIEWNYRVVSARDREGFREIVDGFEQLFRHSSTRELTEQWVDAYRSRRTVFVAEGRPPAEVPVESPAPAKPHSVQEEALLALEKTRREGNRAGLVVMATGLGKTWLSAFDTNPRDFPRVLFVAHREEILGQAIKTFRQVRPSAHLGHYTGQTKDPKADVLFASIQTLGRAEHLARFAPDRFDYVVVDEFHHAWAASYRRLIEHFRPKFLLGLTATPERTDGGDLLGLCQENLVYRCDVAEGIRRGLLCPFHYFGVPDDVDYSNIPWRSARFDEEALTAAVATRARAQNALEQWEKRGGKRTLAFCVSTRHADFMAEFFREKGLRTTAVHSGESSDPRSASLERLERGDLDIVCAVDVFNEGVDLPALDTVLMLRPTESRILWLQQFGRGLRRAEGKERLTVIDYIGNHRTFLIKPQTLFDLPLGRAEVLKMLERLEAGEADLPPGCEVTYDLEAKDILRRLAGYREPKESTVERYYRDFRDLNGARPRAVEAFHDGYNPRSMRQSPHGSWLGFVRDMGDLNEHEQASLEAHRHFLDALETTDMVKSFKMVLLLAMLNADRFPGEISLGPLAEGFAQIAERTATLAGDVGESLADRRALGRMLERNPIDAWVGGRGTGGTSYFGYEGGVLRTNFEVRPDLRTALQDLTREIAEWRLAEYLDRLKRGASGAERILCNVSHSSGQPILRLPDRAQHPEIPDGWVEVNVEDEILKANFVKVAVNVVRRADGEGNELPRIMRGWFGPDAGAPGTRHQVAFEREGDTWRLVPEGRREGRLEIWNRYSREQIPPLFAFPFSDAIWNKGFVTRGAHIFLLVTLDKSGHGESFQYRDRFLAPDLFQWQSQNRTSRASADGQNIQSHRARNMAVHLFVRQSKKRREGGAAPFVYFGQVEFVDWEGEKPITVRWKLPEPVPSRLREEFDVPQPGADAVSRGAPS